jgi:hypothetical protein
MLATIVEGNWEKQIFNCYLSTLKLLWFDSIQHKCSRMRIVIFYSEGVLESKLAALLICLEIMFVF